MKTQQFRGDIVSLAYFEKPYTKANGEKIIDYGVRLRLLEAKSGEARNFQYHKGILFLTKEQYDNRIFEVNDRVTVSDKVRWESRTFSYESHNPQIVAKKLDDEFEKRNVKLDKDNVPYWSTKELAYSFKAKINEITLYKKYNKLAFWVLDKVRFYMNKPSARSLFKGENNLYSSYILKEDFDNYDEVVKKLKLLNGQIVKARLYLDTNFTREEELRVLFAFDTDNKLYYVNLLKEQEENTENG